MRTAFLILALVVAGCGALDDENPDTDEVLADMECEWVYEMQECFCYSESAGTLTWAPESACWATGLPESTDGD